MRIIFLVIVNFVYLVNAYIELEVPNHAFDMDLYENVLDEELCRAQLGYIATNNTILRVQFLDAGVRTPRGILQGNFVDLGNYHQCLDISADFEPSAIEGKYCMINIPIVQENIRFPAFPESPEELAEFPWPELLPNTKQHRDMMLSIQELQTQTEEFGQVIGADANLFRIAGDNGLADMSFRLALCIPKTCTAKQAIDTLLINTTVIGFEFHEEYCRLKNDKPFVPGDYVAMAIFSLLILITIISTCYDLYYNLFLKGDPKKVSALGTSFSLYTNSRRLLTFNSTPGALECLDGIRALAMMWVIVGHTYSTQFEAPFYNRIDIFSWITSFSSIWILAAPITVDTFFLLSGLLITYTTVGKLTRMSLLKNIHLYYLNRLLRMFPILATGILLQATLFNHISDGPEWRIVADKVERCRTYWWSTLSYLQTYLTNAWCIGPTWYLAVDVQLHILSPLVLFWVLGTRRSAWIALTFTMLATLTVTTIYNYVNGFQPGSFVPSRTPEDNLDYTKRYYINTLTRCTPFVVGLLFGYLLNVYKGKRVNMPKTLVAVCWSSAFLVSAGIIYSAFPIVQMDWNSPFWDGIINSFSRPAWAACLGWMIFACTHGYGGPVNWFLCLHIWKLPARISFAMYIFHFPIMNLVNASAVAPGYFSVMRYFLRFLSDLATALLVGFVVTLVVDSPFSTLIKLALGGGPRRKKQDQLENKEEVNGANGNTEVAQRNSLPDTEENNNPSKSVNRF